MSDTRVTTILILAEPAVGQGWERMLHGLDARIWLGREAIPAGERPDIILTNSHPPQVAPRDEVGVIQIGGDGPADVRLPVDCTAQELQLACRLLGEVVRLRRLQEQARETQRELAHQARTDPLTGLANRRAWDRELSARLGQANDGTRRLCLALLDIDQFKQINDTQGHAAGDCVLRAVSHSMQAKLRHGDFVARLGGDEFGLLFWVAPLADAAAIVDRVRRGAAEENSVQGGGKLTASAGFTLSGSCPEPDTSESLFAAADAALIVAKRGGGNQLIRSANQ